MSLQHCRVNQPPQPRCFTGAEQKQRAVDLTLNFQELRALWTSRAGDPASAGSQQNGLQSPKDYWGPWEGLGFILRGDPLKGIRPREMGPVHYIESGLEEGNTR